jgi:hypothetical protein
MPPLAARSKRQKRTVPWPAIEALLHGAPLLKFGRKGEPHFR